MGLHTTTTRAVTCDAMTCAAGEIIGVNRENVDMWRELHIDNQRFTFCPTHVLKLQELGLSTSLRKIV